MSVQLEVDLAPVTDLAAYREQWRAWQQASGEGETNQRVEPEERHGANPSAGRPT